MHEEVGTHIKVPGPLSSIYRCSQPEVYCKPEVRRNHFPTLEHKELAQFEFIVIHKKGKENINADALSRAKHLDEPTDEENKKHQEANEFGEIKITFASELDRDPVVIGRERQKFAGYPPTVHN